jgi:PTS system ascorbate-specific IIA component
MTQILLVAHAPLASALLAVAQHVFPEQGPSMRAVDVTPQDDAHQVEITIRRVLCTLLDAASNTASAPAASAREVLVLVDVFGATPSNAALAAAEGLPVRVVTGVSVPMLWRVLGYADKSMDELVGSAVAGAAQGAFHASVSRRQNQNILPAANDHEHHHHQQ